MTPVVYAALAVTLGTGLGHGRPGAGVVATAATVVFSGTALHAKRAVVSMVAVVLAIAAASAANASFRSDAAADALLPRLTERGSIEVCGTTRTLRPRSIEISADRVRRHDTSWRTNETLRLTGRDVTRIQPGRRVCATGTVRPPRPGRDEAPLLVASKVTTPGTGSLVRSAAAAVRTRFSEAARDALPKTQAGLLLGMTEGDVALLDDSTIEAFRRTGLAHLVAVSGSNVAVVLALTLLVARLVVRQGRWLRAAICVPPLVFFAFLTGLEPSVLRAVVTAGIALAVTADGRPIDGMRIASLSFVVLVFASPDILFHPGFQLSFAATLGLIIWARPLTQRLQRLLPDGRAWLVTAACIATTLAAQAAAAPLLAFHFGQIPAAGGIANLAVAPLAPVIMIGGVATLVIASMVPLAGAAPVLMRLPLDVVLWCGRTFSGLPFATADASVAAGVCVTALLAAALATSARARHVCIAAALVAAGTAGGGAIAGGPACDGPSVVALDVGQGTAVLLHASGHDVLVDGGPESGGVATDLDEHGVGSLDAAFVSHPHADHTEGIVELLERIDVGRVFAPVTIGWGVGADVVRAARAAGVPLTETAAGDRFPFGPDLEVEVAAPEPGPVPEFSEEAVHGYSLVLRARVGATHVLLPGDIGAEEESRLLSEDLRAPVFVAPHHGSKDVDLRFVDLVEPELVLVTVGTDNRYGHPAPEAIRSYAAHGQIYRTDRDGWIAVCVGDGAVEVSTQK